MLNNSRLFFRRKALATFIGLIFCAQPISSNLIDLSLPKSYKVAEHPTYNNWKRVHSHEGKCFASFPNTPEHLQQHLKMREEDKELQYDVYVSEMDKKAVFMCLIAQYPGEVSNEFAQSSLEQFLNSILSQNPNNRLIFADLVEVQGYQGLDFFIRTKQVYFKGRAVMAKNCLYLLAMECEVEHYQEQHFNFFIESFELENK